MKIISVLGLLLGVIANIGWLYTYQDKTRVAYVNNADLIDGYDGYKVKKSDYEVQVMQWQANIDTLTMDHYRRVSDFKLQSDTLSNKSRNSKRQFLVQREQEIERYKAEIEKQAAESEEKMMIAILNQINSFIEVYGDKHNYDIIMGATNQGNILYAKESHTDITEEVLKSLNEQYAGK